MVHNVCLCPTARRANGTKDISINISTNISTIVLLYYYTVILLYYYTNILLYYYTIILLYYHTIILLYYYYYCKAVVVLKKNQNAPRPSEKLRKI